MNPSVFGSGIPFFRHPANLTLLEARAFKTGMVALRYATVGQWVLLLFTVIFTYSLPHKVWG